MRLRSLMVMLAALVMVVTLAACGGGETSGSDQNPEKKEQTKQQTAPDEQVAPNEGKEDTSEEQKEEQAKGPKDKTMKLTVPKMERVENSEIPSGRGNKKVLFKNHTAVHLKGTGFPWQEEANVYIAGHRLGYPGTDSYLAFNDIEALQNGDEVILEDAEGKKYTYEVFNTVVVEPTNLSVIKPIEGKNIVSLQSCTLPDYDDRIIVQAELKDEAA